MTGAKDTLWESKGLPVSPTVLLHKAKTLVSWSQLGKVLRLTLSSTSLNSLEEEKPNVW